MLKAIVVLANQRTRDLNDILHIAASEIQKREHIHKRVKIKALKFIPECGVYVAIYEKCSDSPGVRQGTVTL